MAGRRPADGRPTAGRRPASQKRSADGHGRPANGWPAYSSILVVFIVYLHMLCFGGEALRYESPRGKSMVGIYIVGVGFFGV